MKYATGEYVVFVDSDDWLKEEMIETLIGLAIELNADVVQSGFYYAYDKYLLYDDRYYKEYMNPIQLNRDEVMKEYKWKSKEFCMGKTL